MTGLPPLGAVGRKVAAGERLSEADALALWSADDLLAVGELANLANRRRNGDRVFYNVNRHINPTNVCVNRCRFCAFSRSPGEDGAYTLTREEVLDRAAEAEAAGATEVHMVGGLHPDLPLEWYADVLREIRQRHPALHVKGFTAVEIDHLARLSGRPVRQVLETLAEAGLGSLPGGGAEILGEETRQRICPEKSSGRRWLEVMETAHGLGLRANATMLYGHVESLEDRVEHLRLLRDLQDRTGGFQAFIPLAFQPRNSDLATGAATTGFDDLRTLATARLYLDNFDHVKAYWVMLGEKIAQVSLHFGVDDLDGTVVEERIAHDAGATSRGAMGRDDLVALIHEAGKVAVERDTLYRAVTRDGGRDGGRGRGTKGRDGEG
ncbi:MAG: aminofutalosine synthase MqnE [Deferrisomatales bacterium]|nr:aminofutalosine synthase MqnE [Deferrisomatales bacterium]